MNKPILGIVGGIGSGKSFVAAELVAHGGYLIDADQLGHEALRQQQIKKQVLAKWPSVVGNQGEIDRRALGKIVFGDAAERRSLEALVFPWIERRIREEIEAGQQDSRYAFMILDAAIMLETGWDKACDKVIFVDAPRELRLERLRTQRGWSEQELTRREASQMPLEGKKCRAHAIVRNTDGAATLREELKKLQRSWGWSCEAGPNTGQ